LVKESEELKDSVYTLACDPGGRFLIQGDSLGQVEIRDLQSLTVLKTTVNVKQGEANVWSVALCPEPLSILSGNSDGRVYRWTPGIANWGPGLAETKISIKDEDAALNHTINSVSYSPRHGWVAAGGDGGSVQIYDSDLKRLRSLPTDGSIWYVAFDSKGTRLAFGGTDRILRIIDVDKLIQLQSQSPDVLYSEACHTTGMSVLNGKIIPSTP
jgi:WD40 repeat protein